MSFAKLYDTKAPVTAADCLNDRALPFFEEQGVRVLRILTDRGTEFCGREDTHHYQLFLGLNEIEHTKTKARRPQTNGICERFHQTVQNEFYRIAFRKKIYNTLDEIQSDLDIYMRHYNTERTHSSEAAIRGHIFCSFLALMLRKELQDRLAARGCRFEWSDVIRDLDNLVETEISVGGKGYLLRSETKGTLGAVAWACGVALPPVLRPLQR